MSFHMADAACNARNDLVVLLTLVEAIEEKVEDLNLAADRKSPTVRDEDALVSLVFAMGSHVRKAHTSVVEHIAKHDAEDAK